MKVSVLIPTYNSQAYLGECLDSILMQDFSDLEILAADDGSTDGTIDLLKDYAARDARVSWWQNAKNLGFVGNHNCCLERARGEFIKFLHPDDKFLSPTALTRMVKAFDHHPQVVLVGGRQHLSGTKSKATVFSSRTGVYDGRRVMVACWEQNTNLIGQLSLILFRRAAAGRGFDDRFIGHMDYEFSFHLLEQGDFFYLAEELATWRVHETQQTARLSKAGSPSLEHLQFVETYLAKPWMKQATTPRMLFTQVHYLNKKFGTAAAPLTSSMKARLSPTQLAWQWLRHTVARPIVKLGRRAGLDGKRLAPSPVSLGWKAA